MKLTIFAIIMSSTLISYAQASVSQEDKALLKRLIDDKSFKVIDRDSSEWLPTINGPKQEIYKAYLTRSSEIVKVLFRQSAGWEGQYTFIWCSVVEGRVSIVEAYFGDPSGSGELQYVRQYQPEGIMLGYFEKDHKCVPLPSAKVPLTAELCVSYKVPSELRRKVF